MTDKSLVAASRETVRETTEISVRGVLAAAVLFAVLVALVLSGFAAAGELVPGEMRFAEWWQDTPAGRFIEPVADAPAYPFVDYTALALVMLLALRRRDYALVLTGLFAVAALGMNPLLKNLFERDRPLPGELMIREGSEGYGFPSGHAMTSVLLYGYVMLVAARHLRVRAAAAVITVAVVAVLLVWWDRVWDGAHWPSDVAGGAAFAFLLLVLAYYTGRPVYYWSVERVRRWIPP